MNDDRIRHQIPDPLTLGRTYHEEDFGQDQGHPYQQENEPTHHRMNGKEDQKTKRGVSDDRIPGGNLGTTFRMGGRSGHRDHPKPDEALPQTHPPEATVPDRIPEEDVPKRQGKPQPSGEIIAQGEAEAQIDKLGGDPSEDFHGLWQRLAQKIHSLPPFFRATSTGENLQETEIRPMASPLVKEATDTNFETEVLKNTQITLVDFWAEWCGPCRQLAPTIDALAEQYSGKAKIMKMNVDHNPGVPQQFNIRGIPTVIVFKNGQAVDQIVGNQPKTAFENVIERHLNG